MKDGRDHQPTYENGTKTTMVMMKNNQVGMLIRWQVLGYWHCSPKLLREETNTSSILSN